MTSPTPTPGRIVLYTLSQSDEVEVNRRRAGTAEHLHEHIEAGNGVQLHVGNPAKEGDVYPMVIVRVWGTKPGQSVNGKVLLDGNDTLWVCSTFEGTGPRTFAWPERV